MKNCYLFNNSELELWVATLFSYGLIVFLCLNELKAFLPDYMISNKIDSPKLKNITYDDGSKPTEEEITKTENVVRKYTFPLKTPNCIKLVFIGDGVFSIFLKKDLQDDFLKHCPNALFYEFPEVMLNDFLEYGVDLHGYAYLTKQVNEL